MNEDCKRKLVNTAETVRRLTDVPAYDLTHAEVRQILDAADHLEVIGGRLTFRHLRDSIELTEGTA